MYLRLNLWGFLGRSFYFFASNLLWTGSITTKGKPSPCGRERSMSVENMCVSDTTEHVCDDCKTDIVILEAHGNQMWLFSLSTAFWVFNATPPLRAQVALCCPFCCCCSTVPVHVTIAFGSNLELIIVFRNNKQFLNCFEKYPSLPPLSENVCHSKTLSHETVSVAYCLQTWGEKIALLLVCCSFMGSRHCRALGCDPQ